jgi:hypothetical protein
MFRNTKKLSIIIVITFMLYLTALNFTYYININEHSTSDVTETLTSRPSTFGYVWLPFSALFIPVEEMAVMFMKYISVDTKYTEINNNLLSAILPSFNGLKLYLIMSLASYKRPCITASSNAIPVGGHAPPIYI